MSGQGCADLGSGELRSPPWPVDHGLADDLDLGGLVDDVVEGTTPGGKPDDGEIAVTPGVSEHPLGIRMSADASQEAVEMETIAEWATLDAHDGVGLREWLEPGGHGAEHRGRAGRMAEGRGRPPVVAKRPEPRGPRCVQVGVGHASWLTSPSCPNQQAYFGLVLFMGLRRASLHAHVGHSVLHST